MKVTNCRICKSTDLIEYISLGSHPASDNFLTPEQFEQEQFYPLSVLFCSDCSLSQLSYVVPCTKLYCGEYPYETSLNTQGIKHFREMASELSDRFVGPDDLVVDIGSNDGTLLEGFRGRVVGVEPSIVAEKAIVPTINRFFDGETVEIILGLHGNAKLITATNVFAHIDDLHSLMENVDILLAKDGVFVIEAPYFPDLVRNLEFDTIYHEHLSILSVEPLVNLFTQYNMEIFEVEHFPIHGGSARYYVGRKGVFELSALIFERIGIDRLRQFADDVKAFGVELYDTLEKLKYKGASIVGVSAPAKGNTLLNYCGIGPEILDYITEKAINKVGRYTPGTHIEVVPDSRLIEDQPDYAVILAWNWESQIKEALKDYKGTWIVPTPKGLKEFNE